MEFEFTDCIYVSEDDLEEMCFLHKEGMPIGKAVSEVSSGWDDCDFYRVSCIEKQLYEEIKKRIDK